MSVRLKNGYEKTHPFGWMAYERDTFKRMCYRGIQETQSIDVFCGGFEPKALAIDDIRKSLSYRLGLNTVFVTQTRNESQNAFNRKILYFSVEYRYHSLNYYLGFKPLGEPTKDKNFQSLKDIDKNLEIIGLFMYGSDALYVLFKEKGRITYCLISDVSDQWTHN